MKIQKRIAIALALVVSAVFMTFKSVNISSAKLNDVLSCEPEVLTRSEVNYVCKCSTMQGQSCAVDNDGAECAPEGARRCWRFNNNCHS